MLRKQTEIMENMSQNSKREKEENEDQEKGERKLFSLMAFQSFIQARATFPKLYLKAIFNDMLLVEDLGVSMATAF